MSVAIDIGIDEGNRARVAEALSRMLADTYTLYFKTHGFHWNVTGPMFNTLHAMFEVQYNELWTATDEIAERIRALGLPAPASYQQFSALATVKEEPSVPKALDMVAQLVAGHEAVARTARSAKQVAENAGDDVTVDLLNARLQVHEKTAWMLRSMLEE